MNESDFVVPKTPAAAVFKKPMKLLSSNSDSDPGRNVGTPFTSVAAVSKKPMRLLSSSSDSDPLKNEGMSLTPGSYRKMLQPRRYARSHLSRGETSSQDFPGTSFVGPSDAPAMSNFEPGAASSNGSQEINYAMMSSQMAGFRRSEVVRRTAFPSRNLGSPAKRLKLQDGSSFSPTMTSRSRSDDLQFGARNPITACDRAAETQGSSHVPLSQRLAAFTNDSRSFQGPKYVKPDLRISVLKKKLPANLYSETPVSALSDNVNCRNPQTSTPIPTLQTTARGFNINTTKYSSYTAWVDKSTDSRASAGGSRINSGKASPVGLLGSSTTSRVGIGFQQDISNEPDFEAMLADDFSQSLSAPSDVDYFENSLDLDIDSELAERNTMDACETFRPVMENPAGRSHQRSFGGDVSMMWNDFEIDRELESLDFAEIDKHSILKNSPSKEFRNASPVSSAQHEGNRNTDVRQYDTLSLPKTFGTARNAKENSFFRYEASQSSAIVAASAHLTACNRDFNATNLDEDDSFIDLENFCEQSMIQGTQFSQDQTVDSDVIMSCTRALGRTGAAVYNKSSHLFYFFVSVVDQPPGLRALRKILQQVKPITVLASSRATDEFLEVIRDYVVSSGGTSDQDVVHSTAAIELKPSNDFSYELAVRRIMGLSINGRCGKTTISSVINAQDVCTIRACGALLKYISDSCLGVIRDVFALKVDVSLAMDQYLFASLDIFSADQHPSVAFKAGARREGTSIFSLFNRCKSSIGSRRLKDMMSRPTGDVEDLQERFSVIEFLANPKNVDTRQAIASHCKHLKSMKQVLDRIIDFQATPRYWRQFSTCLLHMAMLGHICEQLPPEIPLFRRFASAVTPEVDRLVGILDKIFDAEQSLKNNRFTVKPGLMESLDELRRNYEGLNDYLGKRAADQIDLLNENIEECALQYLPQVGFLVSLDESVVADAGLEEANDGDDVGSVLPRIEGLEFMFKAMGKVYYKSPLCEKLDYDIGDILILIIVLEANVMMALTDDINALADPILDILRLGAEVDCFLALAESAIEYNLVKPELLRKEEQIIDIIGSRHLIQEKCSSGVFVPNDVSSGFGLQQNRMCRKTHIITGPNASGKSVMLKQIGLIAFLAHVGCFVPAERVQMSVLDGIFSRIKSPESLISGLSSFIAEAGQMAYAVRNCSGSSLVLVDEFGRGTNTSDGSTLLAAVLNSFLERGPNDCPHLFLTTHFHGIEDLLQFPSSSEMVNFMRMDYMVSETNIVYLYQLVSGKARRSYFELLAASIGIPDEILRRSKVTRKLASGDLEDEACQQQLENTEQLFDALFHLEITSEEQFEASSEALSEAGFY